MMRTDLDHLPASIERELHRASAILLEEFPDVLRGKQAPHCKAGRIVKLVLFGPFARPDWREQEASVTAFDILAIVNHDALADTDRYWLYVIDRLHRAWQSGELRRPVRLTVYSLAQVNRALIDGLPFFVEIAEQGIALYQLSDRPLATPRHLPSEERHTRALAAYGQWFPKAAAFIAGAGFYRERGNGAMAALLLHQACEHLYQCVLWTYALQGPRTHDLHELHELAAQRDDRILEAWPLARRFERRAFARIRRAYIEARYSAHFRITDAELAWATERIELLRSLVDRVCHDHLARLAMSASACADVADCDPALPSSSSPAATPCTSGWRRGFARLRVR